MGGVERWIGEVRNALRESQYSSRYESKHLLSRKPASSREPRETEGTRIVRNIRYTSVMQREKGSCSLGQSNCTQGQPRYQENLG